MIVKTETVTTPTPNTAQKFGHSHQPRSGASHSQAKTNPVRFAACDANIAAKVGTTSCGFAENTFYEYFTSGEATDIQVYSPATDLTYRTTCRGVGVIVCRAGDGATVKFSQVSVDRYSAGQADAYAASHDLGSGGTTASPRSTSTQTDSGSPDQALSDSGSASSGCDPAYVGACVPNDGADYNCADISATDFQSVGDDPDRLDADGDGIACES